MSEIVGLPAFNTSQKSGNVAAVVFDYDQPLKAYDEGRQDFAKYQDDKTKQEQKSKTLSQQIVKPLTFNQDGIRPQDSPEISQNIKDVYDNSAALMRKYNGDLTSPEAQAEWREQVTFKADDVKSKIAASKGYSKLMLESQKEYDPVKYKDATKQFAQGQLSTLEDIRQGKAPMNFLEPKTAALPDVYSKLYKKFTDKPEVKTTVTTKDGQIIETTTSENLTPDEIARVAKSEYLSSPEVRTTVNEAWQQSDDAEKSSFLAPYIAQGVNPTLAEDKAKEDFFIDGAKLYHRMSDKQDYQGQTAASREAAKGIRDIQKGAWLPNLVADIKLANPEVMSKTVYVDKDGKKYDVVGTRQLNSLPLSTYETTVDANGNPALPGQKDADGKPIPVYAQKSPNNVLITFEKDGNIYMVTKESQDLARRGLGDEFIRFENEGELMNYVGLRMKDKDALPNAWRYLDSRKARTSGVGFDANKLVKVNPQAKQAQQESTVVKTPLPENKNKEAAPGYRIGEIQGGYRYTGGDPTKQENWEKE